MLCEESIVYWRIISLVLQDTTSSLEELNIYLEEHNIYFHNSLDVTVLVFCLTFYHSFDIPCCEYNANLRSHWWHPNVTYRLFADLMSGQKANLMAWIKADTLCNELRALSR